MMSQNLIVGHKVKFPVCHSHDLIIIIMKNNLMFLMNHIAISSFQNNFEKLVKSHKF